MPNSDESSPSPGSEALSDLRLRRMSLRDLAEVLVIERTFSAPWTRDMFVQELCHSEVSDSRVAEVGGRVAGYVLWWYVADEAHLVNVAVHDGFRRRGIARTLLEEAFACARAHGMALATLEVRCQNLAAINLYESLAFTKVAIRKAYYADNGEDALVMLKDLRPET